MPPYIPSVYPHMSSFDPSFLQKKPTFRGISFESMMLTKYHTATCDPINPFERHPAYLVATVISPGVFISLERLASLLTSWFGGSPSGFAIRKLDVGSFELRVASAEVASEIALRGWITLGCIRILLRLKLNDGNAFSARTALQALGPRGNTTQMRQKGSVILAAPAHDISSHNLHRETTHLTALPRYLPFSEKFSCGFGTNGQGVQDCVLPKKHRSVSAQSASRYGANRHNPEDRSWPEKQIATAIFPQSDCSPPNCYQNSESCLEAAFHREHVNTHINLPSSSVASQIQVDPAPYKTALLSKAKAVTPSSTKPTHHVFPFKPKDLHLRCF